MNLELRKIIDQISKDKGINRDVLIDTLEDAIRTSVLKKYGPHLIIEVKLNEATGDIEIYKFKIVVDEVYEEDEDTEIALEEAQTHDPNVGIGDEVGFKMQVDDLGRIAAQSAKQVIIQRMRDAEQEIIYEEYKERQHEVVSGIIQRRDKQGWIINLGRTEAILPRNEQIPTERFRQNDRVQAIIIDVKKEGRGPQIIVSRSHPEYLIALFKQEVPEVNEDIISIMGVARDPGLRAKVAVFSHDANIDPVGTCVGVRGSRIHGIVQELSGERIDIIVWSSEIATYAVNALSPSRISKILVNEEEKQLEVIVPDDQLTPAIGKRGQNVKLASKLLGWKIDLFTETKYNQTFQDRKIIEQIASAAEVPLENFLEAGFDSVEKLKLASDIDLLDVEGISEDMLSDIRGAMNLLLPVKKENFEEEVIDESKSE